MTDRKRETLVPTSLFFKLGCDTGYSILDVFPDAFPEYLIGVVQGKLVEEPVGVVRPITLTAIPSLQFVPEVCSLIYRSSCNVST